MILSLQFSDSEVAAVAPIAHGIEVQLSAAHVSQPAAASGGKTVSGFARGVRIVLPDASLPQGSSGLVGRITSGRIGTAAGWSTSLSLPCVVSGRVELELAFANQSSLSLVSDGLHCDFTGEANFAESLFC